MYTDYYISQTPSRNVHMWHSSYFSSPCQPQPLSYRMSCHCCYHCCCQSQSQSCCWSPRPVLAGLGMGEWGLEHHHYCHSLLGTALIVELGTKEKHGKYIVHVHVHDIVTLAKSVKVQACSLSIYIYMYIVHVCCTQKEGNTCPTLQLNNTKDRTPEKTGAVG